MKTYIAQLEDHDDFISTRDKIAWSKANRVLLVWPRRGRVLENRVDLLLLQRHSQQLGVQIAIVTRSRVVKTNARELGIPIFKNASQAQQMAWRRLHRRRRLPDLSDRTRADPQTLRARREVLSTQPAENRWLRLGMFTLGVLSFLVLVLFFAPGAQVYFKPVRKPQQLTIKVWASPSIHAPNPSGGLPAQVLTVVVEGRDQINSTGRSYTPDQYASGQVTLKNLTDQAVDVPENSVVTTTTSPPIRFLTTQAVRVSSGPGETSQVTIRAQAPGSAGNISSGKIQAMEGPPGLRLAVENTAPIRGGTDRNSASPSESDYQTLRDRLLAQLQGSALAEIQARTKPGQRLLNSTLHLRSVVEETREPPEGQPGDKLQLALRVEFESWAVNEADLQAVAQAALDANPEQDFQVVPGSLDIAFVDDPQLDPFVTSPGAAEDATARWEILVKRTLEARWSGADPVYALSGRSTRDAQLILQSRLALSEPPRIAMYPAFWARMPYLPARITLVKQ